MVSIGGHPNSMVDFQSYSGPGDKGLRNTELEGYQPVSRIGEVAMNSFGTHLFHSAIQSIPHTHLFQFLTLLVFVTPCSRLI